MPDPSLPPEQWAVCDYCHGSGVIGYLISVYEPGCGFPHDDIEERPCPECRGDGGWREECQ